MGEEKGVETMNAKMRKKIRWDGRKSITWTGRKSITWTG
jgi:hypothetical protein